MDLQTLSTMRIVLLGKTGVGKSAAGNTILGQKEFESQQSTSSVTCECSEKYATVSGISVSVVDTPGLFDTEMKQEELAVEIARSVYLSSPGPHAFLIIFRLDTRFTDQEKQIPQEIEKIFGQEVLKYSIILFTRVDQIENKSADKLIKQNSRINHLVDQCGGRFHFFNNKEQNNKEQVNDLLQKIDSMIKQNGGHYSNQMYKDAQRFRKDEEERRQQEEKQVQDENERMRKETDKIIAELEGELQRLKAQKEKEDSRGFKAFYTKYRNYFVTAAGVAGAAGAGAIGAGVGGAVAGAVFAAGTAFAVGATVSAPVVAAATGTGAAIAAVQRSWKKKREKKQQ